MSCESMAKPNHVLGSIILCMMVCVFSLTAQAAATNFPAERSYWGVVGGYGISHPGWGDTTEKVKTIDLVLRYGRVLDRNVGRSWYRCNHELLVELAGMDVIEPDTSPMISMNFLGSIVMTASDWIQPYFTIGGGPVYTHADIEGVGSDLCGNYQAGGGLRFPLSDGSAINAEARYHHISNLGFASPNVPINSTKFYMGMTFSF